MGGGRTPVSVTNSKMLQAFLIHDFSCRSPENQDTLYLKVVGIISFTKRIITKKIDL